MHFTQRIMITADNYTENAFEHPSSSSGLRAILAAEIRKCNARSKSPLGRVMRYWKGNPKMRIAVGLGLLAGGTVATVTGALGVAGIIMWARAGISALGAFTTSKGIYDVVRGSQDKDEVEQLMERSKQVRDISQLEPLIRKIESRYDSAELHRLVSENLKSENRHRVISNVIWGTAAAVAGILSLGWISEVHAAVSPEVPMVSLGGGITNSVDFDMQAIADDIRADHPSQNWITLEQMVRRVEWLRNGIPLDQSEKLIALNASVSNAVHNPSGIIAAALSHRGYDMSHGVDFVSRRLGESEIREIVQEYVSKTNPLPGFATAIDTPPITYAGIPIPQLHHPAEASAASDNTKLMGASLFIGGALAIAGWWKKTKNSRDERIAEAGVTWASVEASGGNMQEQYDTLIPEAQETIPAGAPDMGNIPETKIPMPERLDEEHSKTTPLEEEPPYFRLSESGGRARDKIHRYFRESCGWAHDPESTVNDVAKSVEIFQGSTFCGSYQIYVEYRANEFQTTILWYDHDAARMHVQSEPFSYVSLLHPDDPAFSLGSRMDSLYEEMLRKREELKSEDMKNIHAVKIPKAHLQVMYDHMEQPSAKRDNNEILGYWISSAYTIQDGVISYVQMANPNLSEQVISRISCRPKDLQTATKYQYHLPNRMIESLFPRKEAELILGIRHHELNDVEKKGVVFTGAACAFNWHKHPDGVTRPSWGDAQEAIRDIEIQFPGRETHPYTIAVRVKESEIPGLLDDPKVLLLRKSEHGWEYSYAVRAYNMLYVNRQYEWLPQLDIQIE